MDLETLLSPNEKFPFITTETFPKSQIRKVFSSANGFNQGMLDQFFFLARNYDERKEGESDQ